VVRILQLGDSHTAGDRFSGRLRARFQERFGDAGRGMLPPGVPFRLYRPTGVEMAMTADWTLANSFVDDAGGPYGISGFRGHGGGRGASVTVTAGDAAGFGRVGATLLLQPGGGGLEIRTDGHGLLHQPTAAATRQAVAVMLPVPAGTRSVSFAADGTGPVDLLSVVVENGRGGVVYDSHGIIGATVEVISRWDAGIAAAEIALRDPVLIVLAFGTNEGFNDRLDPDAYAAGFARRLSFLRAAAPLAAVIVVGPPDAGRRHAAPGTRACPEGWAPPPHLETVRRIQQAAAAAAGAWFWDWSQVMGGRCGMNGWVADGLALGDHIHLKAEGYGRSADALFQAIMAGYDPARVLP
jgi:lysophospholipase L1-like esterase